MKKYKAVLFDFDGVLGNTMEDNFRAWQYACSKHDISVDKADYFLLEGMSPKEIAGHLLRQSSKNLEMIDEIVDLKEKYYLENSRFDYYDGVEYLLVSLKERGYLLGLVSGAGYVRLSKSTGSEFLEQFDVVITADDGCKCKPHPDPYLTAAHKLGLSPSDCLAIENAPLGIESAIKAGTVCIAVCSTLGKQHLNKAHKTVDSLVNVLEFL